MVRDSGSSTVPSLERSRIRTTPVMISATATITPMIRHVFLFTLAATARSLLVGRPAALRRPNRGSVYRCSFGRREPDLEQGGPVLAGRQEMIRARDVGDAVEHVSLLPGLRRQCLDERGGVGESG